MPSQALQDAIKAHVDFSTAHAEQFRLALHPAATLLSAEEAAWLGRELALSYLASAQVS
jgi:hypothetical protein